MHLGNIEIDLTRAALAPMAGISDSAMRRLCAEYGAAFTVSEMISAKAITMGDRKTLALLRGCGDEATPYAVQLFGSEPNVLYDAVKRIEGETFDLIDLNMGCPALKICAGGAGSALLKKPQLAGQFATMAVKASTRPVSVKIRLGWDDSQLTGVEIAKRCEDAGVQMLTIHARTTKQQYAPGVNYYAAAEIKSAVRIPVLINGDIHSAESAARALCESGCDGVMVGRAAIGNPFVFNEIACALKGNPPPAPPSLNTRLAVMENQIRAMCNEKGEERAMREARKIAMGYLHGLKGAASLRKAACGLTYFTDTQNLIKMAMAYNTSFGSV